MGRAFCTGDIHADLKSIERIKKFCINNNTTKEDLMILLGDVGANYYLDERDIKTKEALASCPITFLCIHGNHEERPENICGYSIINYGGAPCYFQYEYPNILFPKDGVININNYRCLILGGAYSLDKKVRIARGGDWKWFSSEQMSDNTKRYINSIISKDNSFDYIFSHTSPLNYEPKYLFLSSVDQNTVDKSMEFFLQYVYDSINYEDLKKWYLGHYHSDELLSEKIRLVFNDILELQ